jgi:hypothetical protein
MSKEGSNNKGMPIGLRLDIDDEMVQTVMERYLNKLQRSGQLPSIHDSPVNDNKEMIEVNDDTNRSIQSENIGSIITQGQSIDTSNSSWSSTKHLTTEVTFINYSPSEISGEKREGTHKKLVQRTNTSSRRSKDSENINSFVKNFKLV